MNRKLFLFTIVLVVGFLRLYAQTDTEFWFVAPEVTTNHYDNQLNTEFNTTYRGGEPQLLRFTTKNLPADITIEQPANLINFPPITFSLPANSSQTINLTDLGLSAQVENSIRRNGNSPYNNKGFHITSTSPITVYYEVSTRNNTDIFALKGDNALGEEFLVPFQNQGRNQRDNWLENASNDGKAYSAADIVATEDGTNITINSPVEIYADQFNAVWPANTDLNITLDRGETFSLAPAWDLGDNWFGREGNDHLGGTTVKVTNGKKIAITKKDDSVKDPSAGCYDLIGDQLVPNDILGLEYIAMRGQLNNPLERVYVYPVENGTQLWVNGNVGVPDDIIDSNSPYIYEFDGSSPDYVHLRADKKVVVLHVSGFGCEMGGAILPPTDKCTGSTEVGFTRATSEGFYINIMVRNGAEDGFLYNGAAPTFFSDADFQPITGTGDWLAARIGPLTTGQVPFKVSQLISNTKDVFHLGIINGGSSSGCRFGYFSNFNEYILGAIADGKDTLTKICGGEEIQLHAWGGVSYAWFPTTFLDDPTSQNPIATPTESIKYKVVITDLWGRNDSTQVVINVLSNIKSDFEIDTSIGVSPLTITFTNSSSGEIILNNWDFSGNGVYDYFGNDNEITREYTNTGAAPDTIPVRLTVEDELGCQDEIPQEIIVYPMLKSDFVTSDTEVCDSGTVEFANNSVGYKLEYFWDFGDGYKSSDTNPNHMYENPNILDTTYIVSLVIVSDKMYYDTCWKSITVTGRPKAEFEFDEPVNRVPVRVDFTNISINADDYKWYINNKLYSVDVNTNKLFNSDSLVDIPLRLEASNACGSTSVYYDTLSLFVEPIRISQNITICEGDSIFIGNSFKHAEGIYIDTIYNQYRIDSIVTSNISKTENYYTLHIHNICSGDSVAIENEYYKENILLQHSYSNIFGCDSIIADTVIVRPIPEKPVIQDVGDATLKVIDLSDTDKCFWFENGDMLDYYGDELQGNIGSWYKVYVQTEFGCTSPFSDMFVYTSIDEFLDNNNVKVYPNPSSGMLFIRINNDHVIEKLEIYSLTGELVHSLINSDRKELIEIDTGKLSQGMYYIRIYLCEYDQFLTSIILIE